jgi:nucleotide-binding universal stress UspA family protein
MSTNESNSNVRKSNMNQDKSLSFSRVLAVVDSSQQANGVVEFLNEFAKTRPATEVIVLNVQPTPENWRLRGYESFKRDEVIDRLINDLGKPIVFGIGQRLQRAGITFRTRVEVGNAIDVILRCSTEARCGLVVIGDSRPGKLRQWIARNAAISFGSVACSVTQLSKIPVAITK